VRVLSQVLVPSRNQERVGTWDLIQGHPKKGNKNRLTCQGPSQLPGIGQRPYAIAETRRGKSLKDKKKLFEKEGEIIGLSPQRREGCFPEPSPAREGRGKEKKKYQRKKTPEPKEKRTFKTGPRKEPGLLTRYFSRRTRGGKDTEKLSAGPASFEEGPDPVQNCFLLLEEREEKKRNPSGRITQARKNRGRGRTQRTSVAVNMGPDYGSAFSKKYKC